MQIPIPDAEILQKARDAALKEINSAIWGQVSKHFRSDQYNQKPGIGYALIQQVVDDYFLSDECKAQTEAAIKAAFAKHITDAADYAVKRLARKIASQQTGADE